jgi:hypothetical protein
MSGTSGILESTKPTEEFSLTKWHRPYPFLTFLFIALLFWGIGVGVCFKVGLTRPLAMVCPIVLPAAVILWILRKDHRRYPSGVLRLTPGEMEFTADHSGPMRIATDEVRDLKEAEGILLIRMRTRPTMLIHQERLEVPLSSVREALKAWLTTTGSEASDTVTRNTARRQAHENLRINILTWAKILGFVAALAILILKIFLH